MSFSLFHSITQLAEITYEFTVVDLAMYVELVPQVTTYDNASKSHILHKWYDVEVKPSPIGIDALIYESCVKGCLELWAVDDVRQRVPVR